MGSDTVIALVAAEKLASQEPSSALRRQHSKIFVNIFYSQYFTINQHRIDTTMMKTSGTMVPSGLWALQFLPQNIQQSPRGVGMLSH